ncbi:hypothetical protein ACWEQC_36530, partial [Streptomyces shenzhenensis]
GVTVTVIVVPAQASSAASKWKAAGRQRALGFLRPSADAPEGSRPAPVPPDVCALGRRYGGWHPDSPESRICEQTYGR